MVYRSLRWRGDDAVAVENDHVRVVVTRHGGQIASLQAVGGPEMLWQPPWPGQRPQHADHRWGPQTEAPLLANICGWNLCLDRFGVRPDDGGRPLHGEAGITPWRLLPQSPSALRMDCTLPLAGLCVQRHLALDGGSLVVDTIVESQHRSPRDIEWCEHISLSPTILDGAELDADLEAAMLHPDPGAHARSRFPEHLPGACVPTDQALAMPRADDPPAGDIVAGALRSGGWAVRNPELGWQLDCGFVAEDFPWLCMWTEHYARSSAPWNGVTRVRGMECSTKPFPEGLAPASRRPTLLGRPTTCTIPAHGRLTRRITLSLRAIK
ncbi:MAG: hypothetical protein EA401_12840 [Planctomycetota bacterium]|nr:MAG: hypothetical protein EA401_12840 [Planctomycetota bacterium]